MGSAQLTQLTSQKGSLPGSRGKTRPLSNLCRTLNSSQFSESSIRFSGLPVAGKSRLVFSVPQQETSFTRKEVLMPPGSLFKSQKRLSSREYLVRGFSLLFDLGLS